MKRVVTRGSRFRARSNTTTSPIISAIFFTPYRFRSQSPVDSVSYEGEPNTVSTEADHEWKI